MKQIQLPAITLDRLLQAEVGEEVGIIVPQNEIITEFNGGRIEWTAKEHIGEYQWIHNQPVEGFIEAYSPLQPQDEFYVAEDTWKDTTVGSRLYPIVTKASQMTPEQSRFHGKVKSVKVVKSENSEEYEFLIKCTRIK